MPLAEISRLPLWLRRPITRDGQWDHVRRVIDEKQLHTVCEEAACPNKGECWSNGNVSFMILGDRCTRRCSFCAVTTAKPGRADQDEPRRLAQAVAELSLRYVVVTSAARDDLADEGAGIFAACVREIRRVSPATRVEVLTPDFHAERGLISTVVASTPSVFAHNLETVRRLSRSVRPQADYDRSLEVLSRAKDVAPPGMKIKSGIMVGLGESPGEVREALADLRASGCGIVTIGQYLRPSLKHPAPVEFVPPERFELYRSVAGDLGFSFAASGPYVRSSYNAFEALEGGISRS